MLEEEEVVEKPEKRWYLPIFTVRNPHKPDRDILVWDAAALLSEVTPNDFLLKGPDIFVSFLQIMYNFRMRAIGVSTHYVRDLNAKKHADKFPSAAKANQRSHYEDDCIDSCHSEEEAITLAKEVREVHERGGFHMRKWLSTAKSKVAPLQPLSILRLELQSAVTGARLTRSIIAQYEIDFEEWYLRTDSKTVLAWLNEDPRRYEQYVMLRIAEICKFTEVKSGDGYQAN
ncbi:uncharacterized protein LOC124459896 [Drosophila willistoni]|uniref:uncharacterized protein LOC124459896 n=1 Tax=Drosophila willistoni TaxID=7260 RepID=UPI001F07B0AB|nr:uncharacterized protein LOC124459896 [Drosophila willistoni]